MVNELGLTLINEGLAATQQRISRATISSLLTQSVEEAIRPTLREVFETLFLAQSPVIEKRLNEAKTLIALLNAPPQEESEPKAFRGVTAASALIGLSLEQANQKVIQDLTLSLYNNGADKTLAQMTQPEQIREVASISSLLNFFTGQRHAELLRYCYITGFFCSCCFSLLSFL